MHCFSCLHASRQAAVAGTAGASAQRRRRPGSKQESAQGGRRGRRAQQGLDPRPVQPVAGRPRERKRGGAGVPHDRARRAALQERHRPVVVGLIPLPRVPLVPPVRRRVDRLHHVRVLRDAARQVAHAALEVAQDEVERQAVALRLRAVGRRPPNRVLELAPTAEASGRVRWAPGTAAAQAWGAASRLWVELCRQGVEHVGAHRPRRRLGRCLGHPEGCGPTPRLAVAHTAVLLQRAGLARTAGAAQLHATHAREMRVQRN